MRPIVVITGYTRDSIKKTVLFDYREGRGREGPQGILEHFKGYLQTDGYIAYQIFDNNEDITLMHCMVHAPVENRIRPVALGRKNYLFAGSHEAAQRSAMLYSLLGTCKMQGIEPYSGLRKTLKTIATHPINRIRELLPCNQ